MKHTRTAALTHTKRDNRPHKKLCSGFTNDEVVDLNLRGISNMLSLRYDEAEWCFSQALLHMRDERHLDSCFASRIGAYASKCNKLELTKRPCDEEESSLQILCTDKGGVQAPCNPTPLLYIYQRQEYDEGLSAFAEALSFEDTSSSCVHSATLLYNVAQTHLHRGSYFEAKKWFEFALARLKLHKSREALSMHLVRIYHNLGHCLYRIGKNEDSLRCFKKARSICEESELEGYNLAAVNVAIAVVLFHSDTDDLQGALNLFQSAIPAYRAKFGESKEVATILNNIGRVHYINTNYDDALKAYEEALKIRREVLHGSSIDIAATVCNTGQTHHQKRNLDKAMEYYREFLGLAEIRLGSNHRDVAIIFKCMAEIYHERGQMEEAKNLYEKALIIGKQALGSYHPELTSTLNKLGNLHYELQDLDAALHYYTEGLHVEKIILEPCHPHLLVTLMNIAQIHRLRGNYKEALLKYAEIHSLQLKSHGPDSLEVAETLRCMGLMEYQLQAYTSAFALYKAALRIQRDYYKTDDNLDIAATLNSIGLIFFNQGVFEPAKNCFSDSLRVRIKLLGPDHCDVAILWYNLATIYLEAGEDDVAIKLYKETLRVERMALGEAHHDVLMTLQHLGLVYQEKGELDEALGYFTQAIEIERANERNGSVALGKLLNLIGNIHLRRGNVDEMMRCYTEASRVYRDRGVFSESLVIAGYNFYALSKLHPSCAAMA